MTKNSMIIYFDKSETNCEDLKDRNASYFLDDFTEEWPLCVRRTK